MRKLTILLLIFCVMVAVSCKKKLAPNVSQSGNPADLITTNGSGSAGSDAAIASFINKYAGVYYSEGTYVHTEWGRRFTGKGLKVDYKLKDGKVYIPNPRNQLRDLAVQPVDAVLPSANKLQLSNYADGEILVLNMTEEGLEAYTSYILEKVSDEVLIQNNGVGGSIAEFAKYKGTYNSVAKDNKIENYIAIDEAGNIFFHDAKATVESGRVGISENELTILENYQKATRKIVFKFDQGVYRRYDIDGENRDETYIGICQVTKDFIEDRFQYCTYQTEDYKTVGGKVTGFDMTLNEAAKTPSGHVVSEGAVAVSGQFGNHVARGAMVGHVSILKGNELHIMGRYNAVFTFSDDWKTATYNGQTLNLVKGEIK